MFTGIVAALGRIAVVEPRAQSLRLEIEAASLSLDDVAIGDSIAVNGVCLTVVSVDSGGFAVDVSQESLSCTAGLDEPGPVNLEKALRLSDRLGGHLVSGHVDGVGVVRTFDAVGDNRLLVIEAPADLRKYIARKGSIAVQGVSLTVNSVEAGEFSVNLIPHTLTATTLQNLRIGSRVNLEIDQVARYVERMLSVDAVSAPPEPPR